MKNSFILAIMDMDITWVGLKWLRPQKDELILWKSALVLAGLTSLFAALTGPLAWLLFVIIGEAEATNLAVLAGIAAVILNTALQLYSAWCWNHRALRLRTHQNDLS